MKIFKLIVDSENGFQANIGDPPQEFWDKSYYKKYPLNEINSVYLDLEKGCKITDVLNIGDLGRLGLCIHDRFVKIIKEFNLIDLQFVKVTNNSLSDYTIVFFNSDLTTKIDYNKSNFILIEDFLGDIEVLNSSIPSNRESVLQCFNDNFAPSNFIVPKNGFHFIDGFNIFEYDAFRIGHFNTNFYVSERLKNALEKENITGVEFIEAPLFNSPYDFT